MKVLFIGIFILSIYSSAIAQVYTSQIEGLLEVFPPFDSTSIYIGKGVGTQVDTSSDLGNTFLGTWAGKNTTSGNGNSFFGHKAGRSNTSGSYNSTFGHSAGLNNESGSMNTFVGYKAGISMKGNRNICIGPGSGVSGITNADDLLYIDVLSTHTPLIKGDFSKDYVSIYDKLGVDGEPEIKLQVHGSQSNDASLGGGGLLLLGKTGSTNIVMDNNEIMARNNGQTAPLYFNHQGGDIHMFQSGSGDLYVHGVNAGNYASLEYNPTSGKLYYDSSTRRHKSNIQDLKDDWMKILSTPASKIYPAPQSRSLGNWVYRRRIGFSGIDPVSRL